MSGDAFDGWEFVDTSRAQPYTLGSPPHSVSTDTTTLYGFQGHFVFHLSLHGKGARFSCSFSSWVGEPVETLIPTRTHDTAVGLREIQDDEAMAVIYSRETILFPSFSHESYLASFASTL